MREEVLYGVGAVLLLAVGAVAGAAIGSTMTQADVDADEQPDQNVSGERADGNGTSPYAGQQQRAIKYLDHSDVTALRNGEGGALGGLAKPAELNSYPGPRHVLDSADELDLREEQRTEIQGLFDEMQAEAQSVGREFLAVERQIDEGYASGNMTEEELATLLNRSGRLYGELRSVHLKYHFRTKEILTPHQVATYDRIRGYASQADGGHGDH